MLAFLGRKGRDKRMGGKGKRSVKRDTGKGRIAWD
jgi:hypothetical protein